MTPARLSAELRRGRDHDLTRRHGATARTVREAGWEQCFVVNDQQTVLGRLRATALDDGQGAIAEDVMQWAPLTIRPDTLLEAVVDHSRHTGGDDVLVTTNDGVLVGPAFHHDAERRLEQVRERGEQSPARR